MLSLLNSTASSIGIGIKNPAWTRTLLDSVLCTGAQMNNNGSAAIGSPSTSSSSSNAAAFDAFLNVIAESANKTAPAAAAAAAASNVDQNPWTSEPPKRSTNPFR